MRYVNPAHLAPAMRILSDEQIHVLHNATLEVLRRTGVDVRSEKTRQRLADAGCWLEGERVRIPSHLINWATQQAPKRVVLCNRHGEPALELQERRTYFGTGSDTPNVVDLESGERRPAVIEDVENVARLVDALPNMDFVMCMGIASDVPAEISDLYHFRAMARNTLKPNVFTAWNARNLEFILAMAQAIAGGEAELARSPFCALYAEPTAPLIHGLDACEKLELICSAGVPVVYTPGLITGASSPVTGAGAVVIANAELLSGLLICQLIRAGAPVIAGGGGMMAMDMRSMIASYGAPEFMLDWCALREMAAYYNVPVFGFSGVTDAQLFDQQAGIEGALWVLLSALAGGNLVHDVGYIESGLTTSYEMLVAMDETIGLVRRFMQGVAINTETIAADVIEQVGPGGHFVAHEHTLDHFRENWYPTVFSRTNRSGWEAAGAETLGERAHARAVSILADHWPEPMDEGRQASLDAIVRQATHDLEVSSLSPSRSKNRMEVIHD